MTISSALRALLPGSGKADSAKPVSEDDAPNVLTGAAGAAAKAIRSRRQQMDDMESEAVNGTAPKKYKAGGMVRRGYGKARGA